jgi:hypothetical protein
MSAIIGTAYSALKNVIVFGEASDSFTSVDEKEMKATPMTPRRYVAVSLESSGAGPIATSDGCRQLVERVLNRHTELPEIRDQVSVGVESPGQRTVVAELSEAQPVLSPQWYQWNLEQES